MKFEYGEKYYKKREGKKHYKYMAAAAMRLCEIAGIECKNVLDIGCASGVFLKSMRDINPDSTLIGIDCGEVPDERWMLKGDDNAAFWSMDLDEIDPNVPTWSDWLSKIGFDFVCFFEVIEHLDPTKEDNIVNAVAQMVSGIMMFTGAGEGQRGYGHINCRSKEYWVEKFSGAGLPLDEELTQAAKTNLQCIRYPV